MLYSTLYIIVYDKSWRTVPRNSLNKSPCSTRAAELRWCGELHPLLYWKGWLFIARESWLNQAKHPGLRCSKVVKTFTESYISDAISYMLYNIETNLEAILNRDFCCVPMLILHNKLACYSTSQPSRCSDPECSTAALRQCSCTACPRAPRLPLTAWAIPRAF